MTLLRRSIYCGLLVLLTATASLAQATAQLTGTVTDPSGGVLPGATVIATQTDTGFRREVVTTAEGFFSLPGMYGLHGCARIGEGVFHTTLNCPSAFTSPIITGLCR